MHSGQQPHRLCSLTVVQKQQIVDERGRRIMNHLPHSQEALAQWAQKTFRLLRTPSQPVMSRILNKVNRPQLFPSAIHKRTRVGECRELEAALLSWVNAQFSARICVNGQLIKEQAKRLQEMMNEELPSNQKKNLKFSDGWLSNFQRRSNLRSLKCHGESGDADDGAIKEALPEIRRFLQIYNADDIFNADEFGHFYCMAPDRTIAMERLPGLKKEKVRLTYLACCNATGSEKIPLMCIGKANKPRCFKKKSGAELGFDYYSNGRARMTTPLFFAWLLRFSSFITRTNPNRKVALLLDNCSPHGSKDSLPPLDNVEVYFLPPNTTSKIQPMDAGIIAAVKVKYRNVQYSHALDRADADVGKIYKVDQLTAMRWMRDIWDEIPAKVISNCWNHTGVMGLPGPDPHPSFEDERAGIMTSLATLVPARVQEQMSLDMILNPVGESDCMEDVDASALSAEAAIAILGTGEDQAEEESEVSYLDQISSADKLRCLVVARHLLGHHDIGDKRVEWILKGLQREVKRSQIQSRKQTLISSFFE